MSMLTTWELMMAAFRAAPEQQAPLLPPPPAASCSCSSSRHPPCPCTLHLSQILSSQCTRMAKHFKNVVLGGGNAAGYFAREWVARNGAKGELVRRERIGRFAVAAFLAALADS